MPQSERVQPHALSEAETAQIVAWLGEERFANLSVQQVCSTSDLESAGVRDAGRNRLDDRSGRRCRLRLSDMHVSIGEM